MRQKLLKINKIAISRYRPLRKNSQKKKIRTDSDTLLHHQSYTKSPNFLYMFLSNYFEFLWGSIFILVLSRQCSSAVMFLGNVSFPFYEKLRLKKIIFHCDDYRIKFNTFVNIFQRKTCFQPIFEHFLMLCRNS